MVLKLYGAARAVGATLGVVVTLIEKHIPFEVVPFDMPAGAHKRPEYLAIHPFGQVPAIDDDGFILFECRAICRYLAEKYPDQGTRKLVPTDLKAKALFEQGASIEFANFHPYASKIYMEGLSKPRRGLQKDQVVYDDSLGGILLLCNIYGLILAKQKFIGGDELTLADLFHVSFGSLLAAAGCDLMTTKGPNVARWWADVMSRPSLARFPAGADITSIASY
ncbi:glutathione S-transferase [Mycena crocata]|nr:glutathione S-transferase [Mycena crocata]